LKLVPEIAAAPPDQEQNGRTDSSRAARLVLSLNLNRRISSFFSSVLSRMPASPEIHRRTIG
jgi:hypothetical protein